MNDEEKAVENTKKYLNDIYQDMIGKDIQFESPIKDENNKQIKKFIIYTDFTASGKGLNSIENLIQKQVLPTYANVHSTVGFCAEITSNFMRESKDKLRKYTNSYGNYSIIFHGQGATGGVHKLIELLNIKKYEMFYDKLKTVYEIKAIYGNQIVDSLKNSLIREIKEQFEELFINTNFCYKVKDEKTEKYIIKCILCDKDVKNEGDFNRHAQESAHQKYLKQHRENPGEEKLFKINERPCKDFIDIIQSKYNINSNDSIIKLINDYKLFKPVIFYSLYEHNSNSLSWKETKSEIVIIESNHKEFNKFYINLENKLKEYKDNYIKIGSFTASSNITGLLLDVDKIAIIIHENNGFAFFDYASGAPYLKIDMQNALPDEYRKMLKFEKLDDFDKKYCYKDGIFFSPHKFIGGPNTPGVLIAHDRIYRNQLKPTQPGGGTVNFVYKDYIDYIQDVELKEESGTPNIIGSIRIGSLMEIMSSIPHEHKLIIEEKYNKMFMDELENIPNLFILHGNLLKNLPHIPVFSFMISFGDRFLHPNYVCALLNDLFGIQSRPGCSCAPNYGKFLLGFDEDKKGFESMGKLIHEGLEIFKPGYTRLNLPYFYPEFIIKYVISAIKFICENGMLLLGLYKYDINSGRFYHYEQIELNEISVLEKKINYLELTEDDLEKTYKETKQYINKQIYLRHTFNEANINGDFEKTSKYEIARWFCTFKDVSQLLKRMVKLELNYITDYHNDEECNKIIKEFEEKSRIKKNKWNIKYQNEIHN